MEQSPWESETHSVNKQIPRLLWDPMDQYSAQKSESLVPILSQMNPVHTRSDPNYLR
jgi:hypothetical protein